MKVSFATALGLVFVFLSIGRAEAASQVVINEVLPNPESGGTEWVELFNPTAESVDLSSWSLVDKAGTVVAVSAGTIMQPNGFAIVERGEGWLNNSGYEAVTLKDSTGAVINAMAYGNGSDPVPSVGSTPGDGKSIGRQGDGESTWAIFDGPTKGASNPIPTPQPTPSPTPTPSPSPDPTVITLVPTDDATIELGSPNKNFGKSSKLLVDNSPVRSYLMKFLVSGVAGRTVISAKLQLVNFDSSSRGGDFYLASHNFWSETSVNWNTAPAVSGSLLAFLGTVSGTSSKPLMYEVNVTPAITADGLVSFRITSTNSNGADYYSKQSTADKVPKLVITLAP